MLPRRPNLMNLKHRPPWLEFNLNRRHRLHNSTRLLRPHQEGTNFGFICLRMIGEIALAACGWRCLKNLKVFF